MNIDDVYEQTYTQERYRVISIDYQRDSYVCVNIKDHTDVRTITALDILTGMYRFIKSLSPPVDAAWTDGNTYCYHDFKKYEGLTQIYFYCTKCDEKREIEE